MMMNGIARLTLCLLLSLSYGAAQNGTSRLDDVLAKNNGKELFNGATELPTLPPSLFRPPIDTRILIEGSKYVRSSNPLYYGYLSKIGDSIHITCKLDNSSKHLVLVRKDVDGSSYSPSVNVEDDGHRIIQVREGGWLNTTINSLVLNDTGKYICYDDFKELVVVDPSKTGKVVDHQCTSNGLNDLVCVFYTNASRNDLMEWTVTWSTFENRLCGNSYCKDIKCSETSRENELIISKISRKERYQRLTCTISGYTFVGATYNFTIKGNNSLASSESLVSVLFDTSLVILQAPILLRVYQPQFSMLNMIMQLNDAHQLSDTDRTIGHIAQAVTNGDGLRYRVKYVILECEEQSCEWENDYVAHELNTTLHVEPLLPYTLYEFSIQYQMANTIHTGLWSDATTFKNRTLATVPWSSPIMSNVGFELDSHSFGCDSLRSVTLHWKALPEKAWFGNGKVIGYDVFDLGMNTTKMDAYGQLQYNSPVLLTSVDGSQTSATVCLNSSLHRIGVLAKNVAGSGYVTKEVVIPPRQSEVALEPCEFQLQSDGEVLRVDWSGVASADEKANYTVFLCKKSDVLGKGCESDTIEWVNMAVGATHYELAYKQEYIGYNFGISKSLSNNQSSGVVWKRCINDLTADLRPTTLEIHVERLSATIEVQSACEVNSRLAEEQHLLYCPCDLDAKACTEKEKVKIVSPCQKFIAVKLEKYNQDYCFRVNSSAGRSIQLSRYYIKRTGVKELEGWEIGLIAVFVPLFIVAISLFSVYIHKQMIKVKAFQKPTVILPDIELEESSHHSDHNLNDNSSLIDEYIGFNRAPHEIHDTGEQVHGASPTVCTALLENDWLSRDQSMAEYYRMGARPRVRPQDASGITTSSAVPTTQPDDDKNNDKLIGYSKIAPSISSYRQLPEDYMQCTALDPGLNLSAGLFYNDDVSSGNNGFDISQFLQDSGATGPSPNKLTVDIQPPYSQVSPANLTADHASLSPASHKSDIRSAKSLQVDLPDTMLGPAATTQTMWPCDDQTNRNTVPASEYTQALGLSPGILTRTSPQHPSSLTDCDEEPTTDNAVEIEPNFQPIPTAADPAIGYSSLSDLPVPAIAMAPSVNAANADNTDDDDEHSSVGSSRLSRPVSISEISGGTSGDSGYNDGQTAKNKTSATGEYTKCSDFTEHYNRSNPPSRDHSGNQAPPV